ncbi:MAG: hypothetical protein IT318_21145 [Anaerolineales bacterium]|nr:hypothetical protein [Anaerolineales bacterium]
MPLSAAELAACLTKPEFPRSASYASEFVVENHMGPNVLWLAEALAETLDLRTGMRVLDLGSCRSLSSIFLAREFGAQVWAADLWIGPEENAARRQVRPGPSRLLRVFSTTPTPAPAARTAYNTRSGRPTATAERRLA